MRLDLTPCSSTIESRERSSTVSTEDVIWANDFNEALSNMQKERLQRVDERNRASTVELDSLEAQLFSSPPSTASLAGLNVNHGGNMDDLRSRATTMELLGLEAPCFEPSLRSPSGDGLPSVLPTPTDRNRATTLDLYAYEQQQHQAWSNAGSPRALAAFTPRPAPTVQQT
jgi:hypothetical protein